MKLPLYAKMRHLQLEGFRLHSIQMEPNQVAVIQYGLPDYLLTDTSNPFEGARCEKVEGVIHADYLKALTIFAASNKKYRDRTRNRKRL